MFAEVRYLPQSHTWKVCIQASPIWAVLLNAPELALRGPNLSKELQEQEEGTFPSPEQAAGCVCEAQGWKPHGERLHCLSKLPLRNWIRQYPALVNCTTINWFSEWPREALLEVAEKYLVGVDLGPQENVRPPPP